MRPGSSEDTFLPTKRPCALFVLSAFLDDGEVEAEIRPGQQLCRVLLRHSEPRSVRMGYEQAHVRFRFGPPERNRRSVRFETQQGIPVVQLNGIPPVGGASVEHAPDMRGSGLSALRGADVDEVLPWPTRVFQSVQYEFGRPFSALVRAVRAEFAGIRSSLTRSGTEAARPCRPLLPERHLS